MTDYSQYGPVFIDNFQTDDSPDTSDIPIWFGAIEPMDFYLKGDTGTTELVATTIAPLWAGVCAGALSKLDHTLVGVPQDASLRCTVLFGNVTSCTEDEFLQGTNVAYVGGAGRWECIYFRDVTANSDGSVTLSRLLRGQRGTGPYVAMHALKDTIVFPTGTGDLVKVARPLSDLGKVFTVYAVPKGFPSTTLGAPSGRLVMTGRSIAPWPPINLTIRKVSSDFVIDWTRVDRAPSTMHDGDDDTPLTDTPEKYAIEIYKLPVASRGAPLRFITGLTTPTYTYLAADIASDGTGSDVGLGIVVTQDGPIVPGQPLAGSFRVQYS